MSAEVTQNHALDMQVCVPSDWTDEQITTFANSENPCGTEQGWQITRQGSRGLGGDPERQPCAQREGYVHVMLHA